MKLKVITTLFLIVFSLNLEAQLAGNSPIKISGVYPHLKLYNLSNREAGVGALVPWAGKLWAITYTASDPFGGEDKLYEIDSSLNFTIRPESTGGTHANRMIHKESDQLIIGPYFIDKNRNVRSISSTKMPGRLTGVARHLDDPVNKVYFYAMEEGLYEVDVHTLDVKTLFQDGSSAKAETGSIDRPHLYGSHGKGAYTGQGRLVVSNNGILDWQGKEISGVLAEWNGNDWNEVDRKQYVEVTGPGGIYGNVNETDPVWATGWDKRSVVVKMLEKGKWFEYRLPKASFSYDGLNGFNTEWPRIREVGGSGYLMTMHGMFWEFPNSFSTKNSKGIKPLSNYLRVIADYTWWNDHIVFGTDDASTFDNPFVVKATHSNLWFVKPDKLDKFGPKAGFGGVWIKDEVKKNEPSDPFLIDGFDKKILHISHQNASPVRFTIEIDKNGNGDWVKYTEVVAKSSVDAYHIFPDGFQPTWVRIKADADTKAATAYFILSENDKRTSRETPTVFSSIPPMENNLKPYTYGLIRPGSNDELNLQFVAYSKERDGSENELGLYEVGGDMKMRTVNNDSIQSSLISDISLGTPEFSIDSASVILKDTKGNYFRLPKGSSAYENNILDKNTRGVREVVTERSLLNCYGTFYELPRDYAGGIAAMKPISTHNRLIYDFCSWRGLMVISGNLKAAQNNGNYFQSEDGKTGLWFGAIDDLWKLGKPHGVGGPWLNAVVKANIPSDPYLMIGYDKKELSLSHKQSVSVSFSVEVDIAATNDWTTMTTIIVKPNEVFNYTFPEGYAAHWVRFKADQDCVTSAILAYK